MSVAGKRFSIVMFNDVDIFLKGFKMPEDLEKSSVFCEEYSKILLTESVYIEIHHLVYLDGSDTLSDAGKLELSRISKNFDSYVADEKIYVEEILELDIPAEEEEDELVETI